MWENCKHSAFSSLSHIKTRSCGQQTTWSGLECIAIETDFELFFTPPCEMEKVFDAHKEKRK